MQTESIAAPEGHPGQLDDPSLRTRSRRWPKRRIAVVIGIATASAILVAGFFFAPDPFWPPTMLHVWGHDYNSTGQPCIEIPCFGDPPPATPVTLQAARDLESQRSEMPPVVLHILPGFPGWLGLTDAGPKPSTAVWDVYLQVGPDAYVPYKWAMCCMPDW